MSGVSLSKTWISGPSSRQPSRRLSDLALCGNPECRKEISEDRTHCNKECFDRDYELRRLAREKANLTQEDKIWPGTRKRDQQMDTITRLAKELCPASYKKLISLVSYRTGLTPRKVREDYIEVLIDVGILSNNGDTVYLTTDFSESEPA